MYDIHTHYENIYHYLHTIIQDPRILYLMPYGSTQPENLERRSSEMGHWPGQRGPMFIFYDQEPIYGEFNHRLLDHIQNSYMGPFVLITTEKNSDALDSIYAKYKWPTVYYFHHIFAAHDWFRGHYYDPLIIHPTKRTLKKKYISFNRITGSRRVYRSLLINELVVRGILDQGYVSYNDICSEGGTYQEHLTKGAEDGLYSAELAQEAIANIGSIQLPLRIDYQDQAVIPNHSMQLSATEYSQESFIYVVTETCFWERKDHLTEKIFKPIVSMMPFVLVGPANNLKYLRSYGFKTFDQWIDESYDAIEDPIERLQAVGAVLHDLSNRSLDDLTAMLHQMTPVLEHNRNLFYSREFVDSAWKELANNLSAVTSTFPKIDYSKIVRVPRTKQSW